ncbi:MAG: ABC transporter permease [Eubacteriales bacterium]
MIALRAGIINEIDKLFGRKKYMVLLLVIGVASLGIGFLGKFANNLIGISLSGLPLTVLSIATSFVLPLIIFMVVADLFTAEQENGSIRAIVIRPVSRMSIFIAKALSIEIYSLAVLSVCFITSVFIVLIFGEITASNIVETFLAYLVSFVPILPIILFSAVISQMSKTSSAAVMLSVLCYIVIIAVCTLVPGIYSLFFTSYTGWYKLFIGASMPIISILNIFAILMAYSLIFFALGSFLFEKKEY